MLLFPVPSSRSDGGHCFLAELPVAILPGENLDHLRASPLRLFEGSRELGPGSSLNDAIRETGGGAFCHWGRNLYFSASDNTDPNTNGRAYHVLAPASEEELRAEAGRTMTLSARDPSLLQDCLSASFSTQGAEFHTAYTLRTLLSGLDNAGFHPAGKTILEIGASPSHGLGLALALLGAKRVLLNNVQNLGQSVPMAFAQNIAILTGLMGPLRRLLSEVVIPDESGTRGRLHPGLFEVFAETDAAALPDLGSSVDLAFSFSVLEHIRHLPTVLQRLREAVSPTGMTFHGIDLRDHTDFSHPLKYLQFSEAEFLARYSEEHNRWRRADYIKMFEDAGWKVVRQRFAGQLPVLANGGTNMLAVALEGPERMFVNEPADLGSPAPLTHLLSAEYRDLPAEELSILVLEVTAEPA